MKRKAFLQKMTLVGVGLGLAPIRLFSNAAIKTYALPKAAVHIPHGNFATAELDKLIIPEFGLQCTVQQFMRNGIEPCDEDMKVFSIQRKDEYMNICLTRSGTVISDGRLEGIQIGLNSFHDEYFTVRMS